MLIAVLAAWLLFPVYWLFLTSLKTDAQTFVYPPLFVFGPTFNAWSAVLSQSVWLGYLSNSLITTVAGSTLALLIGVPAAYALAFFPVKRKESILFSFLSIRFIPPIVLLLPYFIIFSAIGLENTLQGLILVYVMIGLPFVIWIMHGFFVTLPHDLLDAASIDGASEAQTMYKIALPVALPSLVVSFLISAIFMWNEFPFALILTGEESRTTPPAITAYGISYFGIHYNLVGVVGLLSMVPMMLIALVAQRYLIKGLTMGIVKG